MTIEARPPSVAEDATSMIVVNGLPGKAVYWGLQGNGTLQPLSVSLDENGAAAAVLTPTGEAGEILIVSATYGE